MSRRTTVWFGRPSPTSRQPNTTSSSSHVELAVVFKDIATYRPYTVRDSTAYIRDEFFVPPPLSQDGKKRLQYIVGWSDLPVPPPLSQDGKKRLQYIVGWSDLPAARLVVDAERVTDYVSPAAYEDWCAARAAERDEEERRREEEENVRAVAEAEARERGMLVLRNGVKDTPRKDVVTGKRKRRTKAEMAAARAETPVEGHGKRKPGRPKKGAPSLSTPSKARLEEFRELETEAEGGTETPDDEEAIFRQLNGDEPVSAADSLAEEEYDSREEGAMPSLEPPVKKRRRISPGPTLSRLLPGTSTTASTSHITSSSTTTSNIPSRFTPAAQSATPWSLSRPPPPPSQPINPTESAATPKPKPKLLPKPSPSKSTINVLDPDRDELSDVYEVLRLEGLQIRHVRGKPVRYFAVRWKGNWPPDQNPTWEPESNIPRYMTKKYLLNNPTPVKGKNGNGTLDKYLSPGWSQRKYSSVSEAFEGGDPEVAAAQEVQDEEAMEDEEEEEGEGEGEGDEMLVVTDEPPPRVQPTLSW
uniref:Chromo domain-containing protein n=1 Tax=Colletotrichum fructicola (strain Nara gc5) TaxID=1213859 RepID=L2G933_COLFN